MKYSILFAIWLLLVRISLTQSFDVEGIWFVEFSGFLVLGISAFKKGIFNVADFDLDTNFKIDGITITKVLDTFCLNFEIDKLVVVSSDFRN